MIFNSIHFACLLVVTFCLYWTCGKDKPKRQNWILLISSFVFYGWWDVRFLGLLILSATTDFWVGRQLQKAVGRQRTLLLAASCFVNLGVLFTFKYFDFFIESLGFILPIDTSSYTLRLILPIGISFYTFQTLGYTIDVFKRSIQSEVNALNFFVYVAFFPQLVAGPIERAKHLLPQFRNHRSFDSRFAMASIKLMIWGFFKKMVIADNLGKFVEIIYANPEPYGSFGVVVGTVAFAFQIYCDFSGYSDIAIGTAGLFGIRLNQNFRNPYQAISFRAFWQRWHISLSTWFRDYVYIPLGGNRVRVARWITNLMITFLLSGLWHGAAFNFLVWGGIHGMVLSIEALSRKYGLFQFEMPVFFHQVKVFSVVCLCWLFFRVAEIGDALFMLKGLTQWPLFGGHTFMEWVNYFFKNWSVLAAIMLIGLVFFGIERSLAGLSFEDWLRQKRKIIKLSISYVLIVFILLFGVFNEAPQFIYFQF